MTPTYRDARALDVAIPCGVAIGGLIGLIITDQLWGTPQELRQHGWEPGLIMIACIAAAGAAIYAVFPKGPRD